MKKLVLSAIALCVTVAGIAAAYWVYSAQIYNGIITTSTNIVLNLNQTPNQAGINYLSAQAVYSQASPSASTFTDGRVATGTFTVNSNVSLSSASATDQVTIAPTSQILAQAATDQLTVLSTANISGMTITFNSSKLKEGRDWFAVATATGTAASLAQALAGFSNLQVARVSNVIFATATVAGASANSYTLATSSPVNVSTAAPSFSGGHDAQLQNAYLTINGTVLFQGTSWSVTDTSSGTATSIANVLNHISGVQANAVGSVIFATSTVYGTASNSYTLSSSNQGYMTVATPTFTGGQDNATVSINGVGISQGHGWNVGGSATTTASNIAAAINANSTLNKIVAASSAGAVVFTTSTAVGLLSDYALASSTPSAITPSAATMVGGQNSAYAINTGKIYLPTHGLSTGYSVVFSTSSGSTIAPLKANTTYYAINVDVNDIELATTSTGAVAGTFITLTSSSTTGPHSFTLTPSNYAGTASFAWLGSNDCVNYNPVNVSSITYSSPSSSPSSSLWDFDRVNYQCIELSVIPPSAGGMNMTVTVNGK